MPSGEFGKWLNREHKQIVVGRLHIVNDNEDMANLFLAIQSLRARAWFPRSVRDIRALRIEQWSDFTPVVKSSY